MTINLGQDYGNNCDLDYLQDFDMSKGIDRVVGYDNNDKNDNYGDGLIKKISGKSVRQNLQKSQVNQGLLLKLMIGQG